MLKLPLIAYLSLDLCIKRKRLHIYLLYYLLNFKSVTLAFLTPMAKFQMNLVDWFKGMVANRRGEELLDPLMETHPSPRALKRVLLVCLRCIDSDANKRPKMGQIVHMLESEEFSYRAVSFPPLFSCTNQVAFFFFSPYSKKEKFNQAI